MTFDSVVDRSAPGTLARRIASRIAGVEPVSRDRRIIVLAYTLAWGLLVVNRGIYWDDWTSVGMSPASLEQGFREIGAVPWVQYFSLALYAAPMPGLVAHVIVFGAYLLSTLALHGVLRRIPGLTRMDALVAALTFAVLPVNYARVALVDSAYGLSLLAFLAATLLLVRYLQDGGVARRVAALGLYLCSFFTASLLVLYILPIALAGYIVWKSAKEPLPTFALRHADFLVLPVVYWVFRGVFFAPSGVYETYNTLTLRGLERVPGMLMAIPAQVLVEPLSRAVTVGGLLGVVAGAGVAVWLLRRDRVGEHRGSVPALALALVGIAALGLGVFPYLAVGKVPTLWDWASRHQLLVPLGAGLLAAAAVRGVGGAGRLGPALGVTVGLLLGMSIVADARTLIAYQRDWFKQVALIDAVRAMPEVQSARHITVIDNAKGLDAMQRFYRFYEYNALFSVATGNERRLVSDGTNEPAPADIPQFVARPAYHMSEYVPSPVDLELRVSAPAGRTGGLEVLKLVVLEAIGSPSFDARVSRLIDVTASPIAATQGP